MPHNIGPRPQKTQDQAPIKKEARPRTSVDPGRGDKPEQRPEAEAVSDEKPEDGKPPGKPVPDTANSEKSPEPEADKKPEAENSEIKLELKDPGKPEPEPEQVPDRTPAPDARLEASQNAGGIKDEPNDDKDKDQENKIPGRFIFIAYL